MEKEELQQELTNATNELFAAKDAVRHAEVKVEMTSRKLALAYAKEAGMEVGSVVEFKDPNHRLSGKKYVVIGGSMRYRLPEIILAPITKSGRHHKTATISSDLSELKLAEK